MITFPTAPTVAPGDAITSTHMAGVAGAINARDRSGIGDFGFRLFYYLTSLFRYLRNPDSTGFVWPSQSEFLESYQNLDPTTDTWPVAAVGDPEGVNVNNPLGAWLYGNAGAALDNEADRLGAMPINLGGSLASTLGDCWALAKLQRGGRVPVTGETNWPAGDAAASYAKVRYGQLVTWDVTNKAGVGVAKAPFLNSYGGWMPTPEVLGTACLDPDALDGFDAPINYEIKFTSLHPGTLPDIVYDGTCAEGPDITPGTYATHVAGIAYTPLHYYVFLNNGTVDALATTDYLEGPYTGQPKLTKEPGGHLERVMNRFSADFRGQVQGQAYEAGTVPETWNDRAWATQEFLTGQYLLAPARGTLSGGSIAVDYPTFRASAPGSGPYTLSAGTIATLVVGGGASWSLHSEYRLTAAHCRGVALAGGTTINVLVDGAVVGSLTVSDTVTEATLVFPAAVAGSAVTVELVPVTTFTGSTGKVEVEIAECWAYRPTVPDLFLLLRSAGYELSTGTNVDGRGTDLEDARALWDDYQSVGCIRNAHGQTAIDVAPDPAINQAAFFEAARRLSQYMRVIPRQGIQGYAVIDGKSVIWFHRRHAVTGNDWFEGIADAIAHTAPAGGLTNEWMMGLTLKPYHPSDSSMWKPAAYADQYPLINRCHFCAPDMAQDKGLVWHTAYGQKVSWGVLTPESPSGWNYARMSNEDSWHHRWVNTVDCSDSDCEAARLKFYKSCRLYEPEVEVESAEAVTESGIDLVKVTFTGRLHNTAGETAGAPSSVARDRSGWVAGTIEAEPFRTAENALRLYLLNQDAGTNPTPIAGDHGINSAVDTLPDNPYASIYPHFYFHRLVPLPVEDDNDTQQSSDTPLWYEPLSQAELYLRVMCEGYVDGELSASEACTHDIDGRLYDYTFENLCYRAFGSRWICGLPSATTDLTLAADTREDRPQGFGPLPNTRCSAEVFNQFSAAVNLLTRARVMLPSKAQKKLTRWTGTASVSAGEVDALCGHTGGVSAYAGAWEGTPPTASTLDSGASDADWVDWTSGSVDAGSGSSLGYTVGDIWHCNSQREAFDWRFQLVDPDALYAIPSAWRDMVSAGTGLAGVFERTVYTVTPSRAGGTTGCGPTLTLTCGLTIAESTLITCEVAQAGTVDAGQPQSGVVWTMHDETTPIYDCSNGYGHRITLAPLFSAPDLALVIPLV